MLPHIEQAASMALHLGDLVTSGFAEVEALALGECPRHQDSEKFGSESPA